MCKSNVESRLKAIVDKYYPEFQKSGPTKNGQAWFARKDLEVARRYMYLQDGWATGLGACAHNDAYTAAFAPLKERFARAEPLVREIEAARGVKFEKVESSDSSRHTVFIDLKTHDAVAKSDIYCKGDRICVEGKCQSPAPNAAPSESAPAPTTVTTAPVASASGPVTKLAAPATKRAASAGPDSKSSAPAALPAGKPAAKSAN